MPEIPLDALLTVLHRPAHAAGADRRLRLVVADMPTPFVAPKLEIAGDDPAALTTEVIFVEASAAVGKSTIARYLSATLGIPILDLSKIPVSTGTLRTLLQDLKDRDNTDMLASFHAGNCPVIVDALDEGRLLSNETGIESFLQTTAELLQGDRANTTIPKLIFFGRYESIELARNWIEATAPDIRRATIQIGFFDKDGAWQLIQAYATTAATGKPSSQYLQHKEPAEQLISAYFNAIENALGLAPGDLWIKEEGRAFAGYAPVLAAVGSLLADIDNFITVANRLKAFGGQEAWGVIETVLDEILSREQRKLRDQLSLQCKAPLPDNIYDIEEQMALLAQYADRQPLEGAKRVTLPSADMAKYQDMIQRQLPDHPFIRQHEFSNAVLGSAVLARAVYNGKPVSHDRLANLSRQPFIWRSFSNLLRDSALIDGEYVGHIFNSFWNDRLTDNSASAPIYIQSTADDDSASVWIQSLKDTPINFDVTLPIKFYGLMKNCDVETKGKVFLEGIGTRGGAKSFRLQGYVTLVTASVEVDADSIRLDGEIWMEAQELAAVPHLRLLRSGAKVGWGGQFARQFPWNREPAQLTGPNSPLEVDTLTQLVRECSRRFPVGVTVILNPDFSPVIDDPYTRWITRRFGSEFPRLISIMHHHNLAASAPASPSGPPKVKVRFSTNWIDFLHALEDPSSRLISRDFIDEARRKISANNP